MKRIFVSLLLAPGLILAGCGHHDPAARFAEAKAAFAAEDYGHARAAVLAGLEADRGNREMLLLLARADLALGDGDGAGSVLTQLADLGMTGAQWTELSAEAALLRGQAREMDRILGDDQSAVSWRLRGEAALAARDSTSALADFQHGMAAGNDFRLAVDYARFLIDGDDIDGAERALQIMRKTGAKRLDTLLITGTIAQHRGQLDAAERAYGEAAKRFPARAEPLVALADLADLRGAPDVTARYADQARAIAPDQPQVFALTVRVAAEKGDWAKVRDMLGPREASLDLRSFEGLAYGEALLHLGHAEAARAIYQKALLLSPQNPFARLMLAESDLAANDGAGALSTIRPLADSVLAGPRELDVAIRAASMAHDPVLARYSERLHSPQLAAINAAAGQAQAAMARRDWSGALAAYRAIPGYDSDAEVLKRMAAAATNLAQHDAALGFADRALALDPRNPDMLHMAGLVRLNAGRDLDTAQTLMRQELERDPTNRVFRADFARAGG